MPKDGIRIKVPVELELKLMTDFTRYSNGVMIMSITEATTKLEDGFTASISVSVGGEQAAVKVSKDIQWSIPFGQLIEAVTRAEAEYMKTAPAVQS